MTFANTPNAFTSGCAMRMLNDIDKRQSIFEDLEKILNEIIPFDIMQILFVFEVLSVFAFLRLKNYFVDAF